MAHVTFIHGIGNKPEAEALTSIWLRGLAAAGLDLGAQGIEASMVYWADVLYPAPDPNIEVYERGREEDAIEMLDAADAPGFPTAATAEETAFIAGLAAKLGATLMARKGPEEVPAASETVDAGFEALERIPLPWPMKKRFMEAFLRDTHHYLFDVVHSPRPGARYPVQQEIRRRFIDTVSKVDVRPHIVVSHSMGTVIAYDCLKRVAECPAIDGLLTIGSPLGLDEIQDKLKPEWTRGDGFPADKLKGRWINVFDRLDPVAGFDPILANDYQRNGTMAVEDVSEPNNGLWRHSITKYLRGKKLRQDLGNMLGA